MPTDPPRVAILTNMVAPYRGPLFQLLGERFDLHVLLTGHESNRASWPSVNSGGGSYRVHSLPGIQVTLPRRRSGATIDRQRIHLNPTLIASLAALRPDAVVSAEMGPRSLSALLYSRAAGKPAWIWWGGTLHTEQAAGIVRRALRRVLLRLGPRWLTYGRSSTAYLHSLGVPSQRIRTLQNTVDERPFLQPAEPKFPFDPRPAILTVGQLIPRKGLTELVQSAERLWTRGLRFSLVVAGSGPERERLEGLLNPRHQEFARFLGSVPYVEMPCLYRSCDAFVFATLEDVWGLAVNEAILSGLPVACSKFAGCAEELVDPEAVFDPTESASIDSALEAAARGTLAQTDPRRVWPLVKVAEAMTEEILSSLGSR
ncbi:MAG: glycosyltransferase [Fimbriimonadales bacterium]